MTLLFAFLSQTILSVIVFQENNITYFFSVNYTNYDYYDTVICIIFFSDYSNNYIIPLILFALLFIKYYLHSGNTGNRIIAVIRKRNLIAII